MESTLSTKVRKVLTTVEGIYRDGRIELKNLPSDVAEESKVIVTFVDSDDVDLANREIDKSQAEALRNSLATFADDWNSSEMSIYDNYDAIKAQL
jgi:predicted translin family RNA/ssDNA-binding protein